jgi:RpiB/LacA/LacB family sugar-phosphate isomerase
MVYLASDHRGYKLKEALKEWLFDSAVEIEDAGAYTYDEGDDYVDFARRAAEKIALRPGIERGIFICGSGHGMDAVANKYKGLRASLCFNPQVAAQSRSHDDSNVLVLAADWLSPEEAKDIVTVWLEKQFSREERHTRRLKKIEEIEEENFK